MLTRLDVDIAAEWHRREYTTDPPRYVRFDVWSLVVRLRCVAPIRVATLFIDGEEFHWANEWGSPGATEHELRARFNPNDWLRSDDVQLSFGAGRRWLNDPDVKRDPRGSVRLDCAGGVTGRPAILARAERFAVTLGVIAFAEQDIERRRQGRWRVRPGLAAALPAELQGLASGHQRGKARRPPEW